MYKGGLDLSPLPPQMWSDYELGAEMKMEFKPPTPPAPL